MKTKNINQKVTFNASAHDVYEALMDSEKHTEFTGDTAIISREVGGKIRAYGDYIDGENVQLIPDKKIVQKWRGSDWPKGHYSTVTFDMSEKKGMTTLKFTQTGVPDEFYEDIKQGWIDHYWEPMKEMLEG